MSLVKEHVPLACPRSLASMPACLVAQSCLTVTPWTVAHQTPGSMEFSRQEYWSGLPFLPPGDLPDTGIESVSHIGRQVHYC